jgi:predicted ATPase/DNA-binding SARP family transcriptional activator
MDSRWRIELFGGLRATQGEREITRFRTQKTGALLAYLAFYLDRKHPREVLFELLWPECVPDLGRQSLSMAISSLRHQLEPPGVPRGAVIVADRTSVGLNPAAVTTDVAEFEAKLGAAGQANSRITQIQRLAEAVELYQSSLLRGYFEGWILPEQSRLSELALDALRQLLTHLMQDGDAQRAIHYARIGVNADPLREETHRDLMRLYVATGQLDAALRQYHELEQILQRELGEKPTAATRELARQVSEQLSVTSDQSAPRSAPVSTPHSTLPAGTVTFLLISVEATAESSHRDWLRQMFRQHDGYEMQETGDVLMVAFSRASDALACAIDSQRGLKADALNVRMAMDTGEVKMSNEQCPMNNASKATLDIPTRLLLAAHGGQILCSETTAALLQRDLEPGVTLSDRGVYCLHREAASERVFQVVYPDMPQREFPPLNLEVGCAGNLPLQLTRFFGREKEMARLQAMLLSEEMRLVTLVGPGGAGKTRLALEVAKRLVEPFRGAVWFVPLADLTNARLMVDEILSRLGGLRHSSHLEPLEQAVEILARQPSLLVLDNMEHLMRDEGLEMSDENISRPSSFIPHPSSFILTLLDRVPTLKLLVTSRQWLGLSGEREFLLLPLPMPSQEYLGNDPTAQPLEHLTSFPSVQLFVDRAQAVRPDFQVTNANAAAVAELCRRLEGIPLALELAAARVQVISPAQMLAHRERLFDLLVSRRRDLPERHRTLRAAMQWSYELLTPDLQRFFARLSVFRGGWTREAAEQVCMDVWEYGCMDETTPTRPHVHTSIPPYDVLESLAQLREGSLILSEEVGGETRFRMLEMLREFAGEKLVSDEVAVLQQRHATFYLALAERTEWETSGADQRAWLDRMDAEHDNLRAALEWSLSQSAECEVRSAESESLKSEIGHPSSLIPHPSEVGLRLSGALWRFWEVRSHFAEGRTWLAQTLKKGSGFRVQGSGDQIPEPQTQNLKPSLLAARAKALNGAGILAWNQSDYAAARALLEESLAIHRALGNQQGVTVALNGLGDVALDQGDYAAARSLYEESLSISRALGDESCIAVALNNLGIVTRLQGDYATSRSLHEESLAISRALGNRSSSAIALGSLGFVAALQGDPTAARPLLEESLSIHRDMGDKGSIAIALNNVGYVVGLQGDPAAARVLLDEALALGKELGDKGLVALSFHRLAFVAQSQGDHAQAGLLYRDSLILCRKVGEKRGAATCLEGLAAVACAQKQAERAARLFGAAAALRDTLGAPLLLREQTEQDAHLALLRQTLGKPAFTTAYQAGRALTWEQAAAYALADEG